MGIVNSKCQSIVSSMYSADNESNSDPEQRLGDAWTLGATSTLSAAPEVNMTSGAALTSGAAAVSTSDASTSDASTLDASTSDALTLDASTSDAASTLHAASTLDASTLDASTLHASTLHAASTSGATPTPHAAAIPSLSTPDEPDLLLQRDGWPQWFSDGIDRMMRSSEGGTCWFTFLASFVKLEKSLGFTGTVSKHWHNVISD